MENLVSVLGIDPGAFASISLIPPVVNGNTVYDTTIRAVHLPITF